ncbi:hypothetical protein V1L54_17245 [Streptomyces sp. TRM 70361]|uniref:hypothetical protein n=1 Tax=Streptomyces sp. TRM 70361 TaxID=3116553 RepID=UPI002E7BEE12|nr:hypothetical protein [Streptomyces sp. TRM 70361]MEE1941127.1 hypothetical protein [Streptomyces sp. TRM 70361]
MSRHESGLNGGVRPVGSVYEYDGGLHVRVADVVPYEPTGPGQISGRRQGDDLVRCTLCLGNGTGRPVDVEGVSLLVRGGPYGKTARQIHNHGGDMLDDELTGALRSGRRVSVTWAYSTPAGTAAEHIVELQRLGVLRPLRR